MQMIFESDFPFFSPRAPFSTAAILTKSTEMTNDEKFLFNDSIGGIFPDGWLQARRTKRSEGNSR